MKSSHHTNGILLQNSFLSGQLIPAGNVITEYALIGLCVIGVSLIALQSLGSNVVDAVSNMLGPASATHTQAAYPSAKGSLPSANMPESALNSVLQVESTAYSNADIAKFIQTAGANGTTTLLADQILKMAAQALKEGKINEAQYNELADLSNKGHALAELEALSEKAAANTTSVNEFYDYPVEYQGKKMTAADLGVLQGYSTEYTMGETPHLPADLLDPASANLAGNALRDFINAYNSVKDNGILDDPTLNSSITQFANQIASVNANLDMATRVIDSQTSPASITQMAASSITHSNSVEICTVGNGADSGTACSAHR